MKQTKKGFTLIELIVVMAIIAILVLIASPKFMGYTEKAKLTKVLNNLKSAETAAELYYMDNDGWPKQPTEYTAAQLNTWVEEFKSISGDAVVLDPLGKYYDVDWNLMKEFMEKPDNNFKYIIQNPVGDIYYANELTPAGEPIFSEDSKKPIAVINVTPENNITTADTLVWSYTNSYSLKGKEIVSAEWDNNLSKFPTPGEQTVKLRVKDSEGNWSEWLEKKIDVAPFSYNSNNFKLSNMPLTDGKVQIYQTGSTSLAFVDMQNSANNHSISNTTAQNFGIVQSGIYTLGASNDFYIFKFDGTYITNITKKAGSTYFAAMGNIYYQAPDNYLWKYNIGTNTKTQTSFYSSKALVSAIPYNSEIILFNQTATANQINFTHFNLETSTITKTFTLSNVSSGMSDISLSGNNLILRNSAGANISINLSTNALTNLSHVNGKIVHSYKDKYVIYGQGAEIYLVDSNFTKIKTLGYYYSAQSTYYGTIIENKLYVNRNTAVADVYNLD